MFVYVKGADARAMQDQAPVEVLKAVAQMEPGETLEQAQAAGKLELQDVPAEQVLAGALNTIGELGSQVALSRVFANEQITGAKFGSAGNQDAFALPHGMIAISVNLSDTGRVAGFVSRARKSPCSSTAPSAPTARRAHASCCPPSKWWRSARRR